MFLQWHSEHHEVLKSLIHLYNSFFHEPIRCAEPESGQWSFKNNAKVVIIHNRFGESQLKIFRLYSNFTRQTSCLWFRSSHSIACNASFSSNPGPYPSYLGNQTNDWNYSCFLCSAATRFAKQNHNLNAKPLAWLQSPCLPFFMLKPEC